MTVPTKKRVVEIVDESIRGPAEQLQLPQRQQLPLQDHGIRSTGLSQGPHSS
jgi:hypothetical protein